MTLTVTTAPAAEPVSLDEAKAWARVTYPDEDALIGRLISAARQRVEAELGLALLTTGFRETLDAWPLDAVGAVRLRRGPLVGIDAIAVADATGVFTTLAPERYLPDLGANPGRVAPAPLSIWPALTGRAGSVRIDYRAGFGDTADATPEPLRQAILAMVADAFERRSDAPALSTAEPWLRGWRRLGL